MKGSKKRIFLIILLKFILKQSIRIIFAAKNINKTKKLLIANIKNA